MEYPLFISVNFNLTDSMKFFYNIYTTIAIEMVNLLYFTMM